MSDYDETIATVGAGSPMTREDLDGLGDGTIHNALVMRPTCHANAPMGAVYCCSCGVLTLVCAACGTPVGGFAIGVRVRH